MLSKVVRRLIIDNPSKTFATTEITDIGRSLFVSPFSPCLNNGVTLVAFQSSGKMPVTRDRLKISVRYGEITSPQYRISRLDILSRPLPLNVL